MTRDTKERERERRRRLGERRHAPPPASRDPLEDDEIEVVDRRGRRFALRPLRPLRPLCPLRPRRPGRGDPTPGSLFWWFLFWIVLVGLLVWWAWGWGW